MTYHAIRAGGTGKGFEVLRVTRIPGQGPRGMREDVVDTASTFKAATARANELNAPLFKAHAEARAAAGHPL